MELKKNLSHHRILLVEDHEPLAEATADFIRDRGIEVQIAATGQEALDVASTFQPDIVLCDMRLPDISGYEVAQALRKMPDGQKVIIAMHTAMNDTDLYALGQDLDPAINLFLSKPITTEKLDTLLAAIPPPPSTQPL